MQTLNELRATLGIGSLNQIRNRIDAIRDQLRPYMKRGPNNQILIEDEGVRLLQLLQELHDTGLTIKEASKIIETNAEDKRLSDRTEMKRLVRNETKPDLTSHTRKKGYLPADARQPFGDESSQWTVEFEAVRFELAALRERIARLEGLIGTQDVSRKADRWWQSVEEG